MADASVMSGLQDFYNSLMNIFPAASHSTAGNAGMVSPEDALLAHQKMLQQRGATDIYTVNPGRLWGGYDKNNFEPQDLMNYNGAPWAKATST